jgi:hypothetical protein
VGGIAAVARLALKMVVLVSTILLALVCGLRLYAGPNSCIGGFARM